MRFSTLGGLYQKPAAISKLASGVRYSTQPTEIQTGALYVERDDTGIGMENVYMFVRISGTCTIGSLLYWTGTDGYVANTVTGVKPAGYSLVAPTASGDWTFMQVYGGNTTVQITNTVGVTGLSSALFGGAGSACWNMSSALTHIADNITNASAQSSLLFYVGRSFSASTGSTTFAFIDLL